MTSCRLNAVLLFDVSLCVSIPLGSGTFLDKVCKNVDVMLSDVHLPVDMFVLPISDFDIFIVVILTKDFFLLFIIWDSNVLSILDAQGSKLEEIVEL